MVKALLGRKKEMSQIFTEDGRMIPVTIIQAGPCAITQVKTTESKDGYNAYQLAFEDKSKNVAKPQMGHFKRAGVAPKRKMGEFRFEGSPEHEVGDTVTVETFEVGDLVDVSGITKGRGFQGGVRRHGFTVGRRSHGGKYIRHGSTGMNTTPGRVLPGKKMPGHMGVEKVTKRNLEVVQIDAARNLIYIKGAVPGHNEADVFVRTAVAESRRKRTKKQ